MKKGILALYIVLFGHYISAHDIIIQNRTPYYIGFNATFASPEVCQNKAKHRIICGGSVTGIIPPGLETPKNVGRCCLKKIYVNYVSKKIPKRAIPANDPNRNKFFSAEGKITGCGISCRTNKFIVTKNPDNSLQIVRE